MKEDFIQQKTNHAFAGLVDAFNYNTLLGLVVLSKYRYYQSYVLSNVLWKWRCFLRIDWFSSYYSEAETMQIMQKKPPTNPSWVECHHRGLRKYLIAGTEFYILSCPPPTGPASSCGISPDNETSVKAIGQWSKRGFQETRVIDKSKRQQNS